MDILNQVLGVFTEVGAWIGDAVNALVPMFYRTLVAQKALSPSSVSSR